MFTDPAKNLGALGLQGNSIVADLGAGTGFYSVEAGKLVPQGKVYAVEVVKEMLSAVKNKARDAGLSNVECIWGDIEKIGGTKIKDKVVDLAILSNILFQVEHKDKLIEETKRILKPGGQVLFVDWLPGSGAGIQAIPKTEALKMFEERGMVFQREINAGAHHYGMILINKSA